MSKNNDFIGDNPTIAISSCLLGEPVRYDGGDQHQQPLHDFLAGQCNIISLKMISLCPELEMGLGVPRAPIQVVIDEQQRHLREVTNPDKDYSQRADTTARQIVQKIGVIDGWIFKARSPSCGISDTPIFNTDGQEIEKGAGVFAKHIVTTMPWLPCATELELSTETEQQHFLNQCQILAGINHWLQTERSAHSLIQIAQNIRPRIESMPDTLYQEQLRLLQDKTRSVDDRFYQLREVVMGFVNQTLD
jgi:uncharacterized protein YbbK (DUF523 family)